jgi:hypothetical protein
MRFFNNNFTKLELRSRLLRLINADGYATKGKGDDPETAEPGATVNHQKLHGRASGDKGIW